jgi:hypothetical protein
VTTGNTEYKELHTGEVVCRYDHINPVSGVRENYLYLVNSEAPKLGLFFNKYV